MQHLQQHDLLRMYSSSSAKFCNPFTICIKTGDWKKFTACYDKCITLSFLTCISMWYV